eukprot:TRINITY_DN35149_c0_g1_i1.p1 TRINITY_DN35149_c0_g1~~TRINITY_DN35149_c0_g1_i1.p1  ORF type:complete len:378 (-),score=71.72 TRINITY_DN35149_c0_g1_i1:449-1486(-)
MAARGTCRREIHNIKVNGQDVQLRVFIPTNYTGEKKPAVIMVCGLMWFGHGFLGAIGNFFNDFYGYAWARHGAPCVQIHTPSRHLAHTRFLDLMLCCIWPMGAHPIMSYALMFMDILHLGVKWLDFALLLAIPVVAKLGVLALPVLHVILRVGQYLQGTLPAPKLRSPQDDIAAAVVWAKENQHSLGSSDGRVLCGYSSGGHGAALYAHSDAGQQFEKVVLISGVYNLETDAFAGLRRFCAPGLNVLFNDVLGVSTKEERSQMSADISRRKYNGQPWYILTAKMELMGIQPWQDIFFNPERLCSGLKDNGAEVHRVQCGLNHWTLIMSIEQFIEPFCKGLGVAAK